ncbi:Cu(I)-responsive transcriptional regulator [Pasteurellaceae bacterium 15-036681]|nr:Cu(I)-responsive transcriptional regulator [Pasteurellaceae bacterium 15-036681]
MNISKVAKLTGLSTKQIRDYEKIGLLKVNRDSQSGYRDYNPQEIERLQFIARSRAVGFSLAQIQALLALQDDPNRKSCEVKALTSHHIEELNQKIAELQAMKDTLQVWHNECKGDTGSDCPILRSLTQGN